MQFILENSSLSGNLQATEYERILETENALEVERLIPLIVYLVVISVTGLIGNGLVCYIYLPQENTSSTRWFIFYLAVVDLIICLTVVPLEIATLFYQYNFRNLAWCKCSAFVNVWSLLSLALVLVIIAIDRYRKVCKPHGCQLNVVKSKILSVVVVFIALLISIPAILIYEIHELKFQHLMDRGIIGSECTFKTNEDGFSLNYVYIGFGMILFVSSLVTICVLYCCIGVVIKRHTRKDTTKSKYQLSVASKQNTTGNKQSSVDIDETSGPTIVTVDDESNDTVFTNNRVNPSTDVNKNRKSKSFRVKSARAKKATFSMFLISLAFVVCYLPFLSLILVRNMIADFENSLSDELRTLNKFFLRSYFLCYAINPFIYGFSDSKFRQKCTNVLLAFKDFFFCRRYKA
ncbi:hypothetical protein ACF0H5_022896 [Mactra antiquata]